jgi:guanosine-3',5'-bis(diphosphate) 3'-pyrophosphohydrolase
LWKNRTYLQSTKTIAYAALKHGEQKMPTGLPYVVHLSNVAMEVVLAHQQEPNFNLKEALQLALLHDSLEDTDTSFEEIEHEFGKNIADGVLALTKNQNLEKQEQMADSLHRILKKKNEVAIVKLCDRITNLQPPPPKWEKEKIKNYYLQAKTIADNLKGKNNFLDQLIKEKIENYSSYF